MAFQNPFFTINKSLRNLFEAGPTRSTEYRMQFSSHKPEFTVTGTILSALVAQLVDRLGGDGFWDLDYGWGVRVCSPFGARGMSSVRYGTRLGDLKNKQSTHKHKHKFHWQCVMSGLIHTGLGSSSLIAHVLHSPPPPPANSFVIGPAVVNTHSSIPYRTHSACQNGGVPGPPPVILVAWLSGEWCKSYGYP